MSNFLCYAVELHDATREVGREPSSGGWGLSVAPPPGRRGKVHCTHLWGSNTEALGGDLAYRYGLTGSLAGIALDPAQEILSGSQFGSAPQTLQPLSGLQDGLVKLS
jgi:hypothetical protein